MKIVVYFFLFSAGLISLSSLAVKTELPDKASAIRIAEKAALQYFEEECPYTIVDKITSSADHIDQETIDVSVRLMHSNEHSASIGTLVYPSIVFAVWKIPNVDIIGIGLNKSECGRN
ncbi:MAG: hypothetical protein AAFQ87_24120 [Bacteroidota bacterium]